MGGKLDLEMVLKPIVEAAITLVQARYGALGVIGDGGQLAEFVPVGLADEQIAGIHHWPEGLGLLGALISDPRPLRLPDIAGSPNSQASRPGTRRCGRSSACRSGSGPRCTATCT